MKKIIFSAALIISLTALTACGETEDATKEDSTTQEETTATATETAPEETEVVEEAPKEETVGVGTPKQIGDATFTVNAVSTAKEVGSQYLSSTAQGTYLVVNVTYQNNGNEATTMDASFFKLKYGEKTYDADSTASLYANSQDDGSTVFLIEQVNPDMSVTGDIIFDVTDEVANATGLQLQAQTGFFGTETGLITIQ